MKSLKFIDSSNVIAIDIETVRYKENFEDLSEEWQSAWEYKNKQDGVIPPFEELCKLWQKNASLYAEFSKVCAVSLVYLNKDKLKCKEYTSHEESLLLEELAKDLNAFSKLGNRTLVGHSSIFFDYPFLAKRYIINGMEVPDMLDEAGAKPWEKKLLCTNELWRSFGSGAGSSLQALCTALNLEVSKVDLVGDEVGAAYFRGELVRIASYCSLDTIATYNVFRKFKRESIFKFEDVEYVNQGKVLSSNPLFEELMKVGRLTAPMRKRIDKAKEGLTDDEILNLKTIILACVKEFKSKEEQEFFESL